MAGDPWAEFADAPAVAPPPGHDPWAEFEDAPKRASRNGRPVLTARKAEPSRHPGDLIPSGEVVDGDTLRLTNGGNGRLSGVDAFELGQEGRALSGHPLALGSIARKYLADRVAPGAALTATGRATYGRPVVKLENDGVDVGRGLIEEGLGVPTPEYLKDDPAQLDRYVRTQRDAIAAERGAYAGQYQRPDEYRKQGAAAPMRGKIAMTPQQASEYAALVRNPATTVDQLSAWIEAQGHHATNLDNLLRFVRRNPNAPLSTFFQQSDVLDQPVLRDGPGIVTRGLAALNEGIPDVLGAPVDLVNAGLGVVGLPVSDKPFLGSESIRSGLHALGVGQTDDSFAPRSTAEAYGQAFARGVGQAAIPAGGIIGAGGRLALAAPTLARGGAVAQATRGMLVQAARRPGVALAGEVGAGVGAGAAGQAARDAFPGNPWAEMGATIAGGFGGGIGAGLAASARPRASVRPASTPPPVAAAPAREVPPPPGYNLEPPPGRAGAANDPIGVAHDTGLEDVIRALDDQLGREADALQERLQNEQLSNRITKEVDTLVEGHPDVQALIAQNPAAQADILRELRRPNRHGFRGLARVDLDGLRDRYETLDGAYHRLTGRDSAELDVPYDKNYPAQTPRDYFNRTWRVGSKRGAADYVEWALGDRIPSAGATRAMADETPIPTLTGNVPRSSDSFAPDGPKPRRLFHGTPGEWQEANPNGMGMTFFAEDAATAARYAQPASGGRRTRAGDPNLYSLDLPENARLLDITTDAGVRELASLPVEGRMSGSVIQAARDDVAYRDRGGTDPLTRAGNTFWSLTKRAEGADAEGFARHIADALAERGYTGIRFLDDQHKSVALFDRVAGLRRPAAREPDAYLAVASAADPDEAVEVALHAQPLDHSLPAPAAAPGSVPPLPPGFVLDAPIGTGARPVGERMYSEEMAALARTVEPEDVRPIPGNQVESLDEAIRANPGTTRDLVAPDERNALPPYKVNGRTRRDPLDLIGWLRTKGGIRDERSRPGKPGVLAHMGIDNAPRSIEFAKSEGFLGKLVRDDGMNLDDAALRAWEAGYFPGHADRPTIREFLDALEATHRGGAGRVFHPDDYATLDAYRAAQDQRFAVEKATDEGSPLAEEIGEPVTLDDLDANTPPATAYEDLPTRGGRAGNIRLDGLNSPQDIRRALISTDAKVGGFDAARRGVVSHAETEALASELGMTADDLLKRRQGQALNAEQALAARQILAKSSDELVRMAGKAVGGSDADKAAFRQAWLRHVAIQEQVSGATAEAGRALQQFRMTAESRAAQGRIHKLLIEQAGGDGKLDEVAKAIVDLQEAGTTPGGVTRFARDALKPKLKDKLVELYYNALLSGPQTHVVNTLSNTLTAGLQLPEHLAAAGIGAARRAATLGRGGLDRVLLTEVGARTVGLMQGTKEGLAAFARTARTGVVPDHVTKVEAQVQEAISGLKGKVIRTPTRLLSAEDELFKAIGRRMEIAGLATRQARLERLKGDALKARIVALSENPTDEMVERSLDYARYVTFQRPLGKFGTLLTSMTQEVPALKLIVPFVRTPTNILKFATERSPAAPILKEVRADLIAGGARRDLAVARIALGSGLAALAMQWAADGTITGGGPADKDARALMMADGWQPYSVRIGDKYYSYQRFDPLATTLGVAADFADVSSHMTEAQRERTALTVVTAIIKNLSNKVWLSGITDMSQAISDPDRYGTGFLSRIAGSITVPAVVAQTARVVDPVVRDAREPIDRIRSRIPWASKGLPAKRDVFGEVITAEGGVGPDVMSPMRTSTARNDPVVRELLAIEAGIKKPDRKVKGRELSADEYDAYSELAGRMLRVQLEEEMGSPHWSGATTEEKKKAVDDIKESARKAARLALGL